MTTLPGVNTALAGAVRRVNAAFFALPPDQCPDPAEFDPLEAEVDEACRAGDADRALAAIAEWEDHWLAAIRGGRSVSQRTVPRIALNREEAAAALGMSLDSFERHVQHEVQLIRRGRMRLVPVQELERWAQENAERPLAEEVC